MPKALVVVAFLHGYFMSTDLYGVRIEEVESTDVYIRVFLLYTDFSLPSASADEFFMGILSENLHPIHLPQVLQYPLAQEIYGGIINSPSHFKREKHYSRCLEQFKLFHYPEKNADVRSVYIEQIEELEHSFPSDEAKRYTFNYLHNGKFGYDETQLEQALFFMRVTDEKWLRHWYQGLTFATTTYAL